MKNIENIKKVSLIFFITLGFAHILAFLLLSNGIEIKLTQIITKILLVPFITTALIYGLSSLRLLILPEDRPRRSLDYSLAAFTGIITLVTIVLTIIY
ncbi:MAG: hypothetical protein RBS56_03135 [Candidatus Gracilibacteria bacterium]|jgi:hypothetical protein|nr:hypothetical protein [Candidatus Gracilibacteria bacterium]